ncbi:RAI1 like PD-XK nuclease-domain-containing protein [Cladorrhinum sp. PSN332]|nr:RAI1 like PD-XK nuclease-domain-containing protein [Cladorrhinum sp. PSN332]
MAATFPVAVDRHSMPTSDGRVKRPIEFACFSYDKDHQFRLDDSSLKWYYPPQGDLYDVHLSRGFETFDKLDDSSVDEHLDSLLKTIAHHEQKTGKAIDANVVTWRGMMTKIMGAPYDDEGFEMNATLYRDCIFIEENHAFKVKRNTEQNNRQRNNRGPPPEVMQFWGYKFETLCTLPRPWGETTREYIESRDSLQVSNKEQYCSVVRTGIDSTILCLGGEVDAIWDAKPLTPGKGPINWVELKTSAEIKNEQDESYFRRKSMRFWIQSYLLGVPKVVVGFRDRNGYLKSIEEFETKNLPWMASKDARVGWKKDGCVEFASKFLSWLRETINDDGVWRIRRQRGAKEIEVWRVEEAGHGEILTEEFMNWRIKLELMGSKTEEMAVDDVGKGDGQV